jgi:DNA-binding CsgD family transcriptional regulator
VRARRLGGPHFRGKIAKRCRHGRCSAGIVLSPLSLALRGTDGSDPLDARTLHGLLLASLARRSEGVIACDETDAIRFACPRATKLLEPFGGLRNGLPGEIRSLLGEWRDAGDVTLTRRLRAPARPALHVTVASPWAIPHVRAILWLQAEHLRDDRLYAALHALYGLSRRAFQLALLVRQGQSNREIARELRLSEATVKVYLHHLYRACGVASRTALVALMERAKES